MASYQKDILEYKKPKGSEYQDYLTGLENQSITQQKQFGELGARPTGLSAIQRQSAQGQYEQAQQPVRQKAEENKYALGSAIDTRRTQLSDQIQALRNQKEKFGKDLSATSMQNEQAAAQGKAQQEWQTANTIKGMGFQSFVNDQDREDAITNAYSAGNAEIDLLNAANQGALKVNDVDAYFNTAINDIQQDMEDWSSSHQVDFETWWNGVKAKASNISGFVSAATDLARTGVAAKYGSKSA